MAGTEEFLYADDIPKAVTSWSSDGKFMMYASTVSGNVQPSPVGSWILPLNGERKPFRFAENSLSAARPQFSPDGHWVAYSSIDSRRPEIYIAPFPGPGGKVQVSTTGGVAPRWSHDGKELFYLSTGGQMMAAEMSIQGGGITAGRVQALFDGLPTAYGGFDVSLDGQRFLVAMPPEQAAPGPLTLVQNWTAVLKK
jgi:Tol biopolymer transport system component